MELGIWSSNCWIMKSKFGRKQLFTIYDSLGLGLILGAIPNWEGSGSNMIESKA